MTSIGVRWWSRNAVPIAVLLDALETTTASAPKKLVVVEKVVNEEGREEERPEHHSVVLVRGILRRIGVDPAVPVVRRWQGCAVRRGVDEPSRGRCDRV